MQKIRETGYSRNVYQNKPDKVCFQHDMTYRDFKDLTWTTASGKILHKKAFDIAKNPKYYGNQCELASMVYTLFDNESSGSGVKSKIMLISN